MRALTRPSGRVLWALALFVVPLVLVVALAPVGTLCAVADGADPLCSDAALPSACAVCATVGVGLGAILSLWYWLLPVPYYVLLPIAFWIGVIGFCRAVL